MVDRILKSILYLVITIIGMHVIAYLAGTSLTQAAVSIALGSIIVDKVYRDE